MPVIRQVTGQEDAEILSWKTNSRGWPGGAVVKFACSTSAAWGSPVWIPGVDMAPLSKKSCCDRHPRYKVEEDGHGCELRAEKRNVRA